MEGRIVKVSGPLVVAQGVADAKMFDVCRVSEQELVGEIIELRGDRAWIQVYEETGGLGPGDPVVSTGQPLGVDLGPGIMGSIYDGIQRPLDIIERQTGPFIPRGVNVPALDQEKAWTFEAALLPGAEVVGGTILGSVPETTLVDHKILVPPFVSGTVTSLDSGSFTVTDQIGEIETAHGTVPVRLSHRWPVRRPRPYARKLTPVEPLLTGQRVLDTLFPVGKGGTACVPGPFGAGKTVIQHQLAKWSDAQIIVYVGCGERGNEMTDVLQEFPELRDPKTGEPLMKRTVLIANTSNMPVAAREASIYTGISLAEYYRDMGYSVALMADSTSRWAEALREISGRLEEMPGEQGYPAYLPTRIAQFYERAGRVICAGGEVEENGDEPPREGALSVIGAVSPPGGDLSDPVVQATLKVVKVFWSLQDTLAYERHFPAIDWLTSYSLYHDQLADWFHTNAGREWGPNHTEAMRLLQIESELTEIARIVGVDSLSADDRLILETGKSLREDFLQQNAFHDDDSYATLTKQAAMLTAVLTLHESSRRALEAGASFSAVAHNPIRQEIARAKYLPSDSVDEALADLVRRAAEPPPTQAASTAEVGA